MMDEYEKITSDNLKVLNNCILDLMGDSYQTFTLESLQERICINSMGKHKFDETLKKHGVKITNTHGFTDYWINKADKEDGWDCDKLKEALRKTNLEYIKLQNELSAISKWGTRAPCFDENGNYTGCFK